MDNMGIYPTNKKNTDLDQFHEFTSPKSLASLRSPPQSNSSNSTDVATPEVHSNMGKYSDYDWKRNRIK